MDTWLEHYHATRSKALELDSFAFARSISPTSFGVAAVSICGEDEDRDPSRTEKFWIVSRRTQIEIGDYLRDEDLGKSGTGLGVSSASVEIEKPFALRLIRVWRRAIESAERHEIGLGGLDGSLYEFMVPDKNVEAWEPSGGSRFDMLSRIASDIEIGSFAIHRGVLKSRSEWEARVNNSISRLEKFIDEHPPNDGFFARSR